MPSQEFQLKHDDEYIELLKLLQIMGIAQTGGHAKIIIENGEVAVNGIQEFRKRNKLRKGDLIKVGVHEILISQG